MMVSLFQTAALIGDIKVRLPAVHHPRGGSVYVVRDGAMFLYIGKTVNRVWPHIRQHLRSADVVGRAVRAEAPRSARWRVEVCNFGGQPGFALVEPELIRRYRPWLNWAHNTGRPRTPIQQLRLQNRSLIGPACLAVIDDGWPSFGAIDLEEPRPRKRRA